MAEKRSKRLQHMSGEWHNFDDYPPGTPLPEPPLGELAEADPDLRARAEAGLSAFRRRRQSMLEAARDEHFRRKETDDDEDGLSH